MRNIEIKARVEDVERAGATAARLTGGGPGLHLRQVDTYFNVPEGRLKLREFGDGAGDAELIFYRRPDREGPSLSRYAIATVRDASSLKAVLGDAPGIKVVVKKTRAVFLREATRIHLDEVEGLGDFIEFEVVLAEGSPESDGEAVALELMREFSIDESDLVSESYCDLLQARSQANHPPDISTLKT